MIKLVAFSGSEGTSSKTSVLRDMIAQKAVDQYRFRLQQYDMTDLGPSLGLAKSIDDLDIEAKSVITAIAEADALIIVTPVYKGSYPGLFKHFIDLLDVNLLYGKPIILAATGGGTRHALMVEHQLRPLFGFFMAHSLPTAIYASSQDYSKENKLINQSIISRIEQGVREFQPFIQVDKMDEKSSSKNHLFYERLLQFKLILPWTNDLSGER
ncbi:NAD(P)H-dependent oxidoreductase [Ignatzschineria larvae DSM 13226]|uniref:NAD(P)H-dependent oxidoreductase n=1 Tax=Ignatzschineria larvae DSM 13226 TaxID=1111732 RepID=A0ABZ3C3B6_9GAMM|nr:NAD(P)H-dependent oxidoreductase [Ignatzschineria larvae]